MVAVQHGGARRSVALVVGGGLSLSAFTFTWLGRRSRRQPRPIQRHAARSIASRKTGCKKAAEGQERQQQPSCLTCLERRKRPSLELHFLYASPILRPGSAERLPALSWQEEAAAVQDALGLDAEADAGSAIENDTSPSSASTYPVSTARMHVNVATVEVLSRLAAGPTSCAPPAFASMAKQASNRIVKIKALLGFMCVPYLVAAIAVAWQAVTVPALGELQEVDMRGKTILITGATSGLGLWQAEVLARWNASLILPVRDLKKGQALLERFTQEFPASPAPVVMVMDLGSLQSVRDFAEQYTGPVDVLVHNAAILGTGELIRTEDGFEECLQVNYLSSFLLTHLLLPRLEQSAAGRIVHVSAKAHEWGNLSTQDLRSRKVLDLDFPKRRLRMMGNLGGSYADSKLAQVLFSNALARRLPPNVVTHALHPAIVPTGLLRQADFSATQQFLHDNMMQPVMRMVGFTQSKEDAPKTQIHVSTHPAIQDVTGRYYSPLSPPLIDCGQKAEYCGISSISDAAADRFLQEDLFDASCELLDLSDGLCATVLESCPSWWHIAAHSEPGTGRLILEDEDGAPQVVSMAAQLFTCQTPPLGVSILACAGEQAGRALLSAGASFAVVSSGELRDTTARIFASHFYRRLQSACAMSSEPSGNLKLGESFASQVRLAFGVAREALQTATNPAVRVEARKLLLLERGLEKVPSATSRRSLADCWMPVAMSSEILPGARAAMAKTGMEDEASTSAEDNAGEMIAEDSASSLSTSSKETFPQDCEDFVGRSADLQRLLQILGTSGGRRLVILHGPNGAGKSALGAELCRFATSPGRKFAPVKGNRRLAFVSLQDPGRGSDADTAAACARLSIFAAAAGLGSPKSFEGRLVRTCLVVDDAEERLGWRDEFVPELLDKHPQLCILLLRRSPLYRLAGDGGERWKPVNITLGPLPEMEAAQLFLQRLHRPIFPTDLSRDSEKAGEPLRPTEELLRRMTELPALAACKGFPRKVVRLAAEVTWELPSLFFGSRSSMYCFVAASGVAQRHSTPCYHSSNPSCVGCNPTSPLSQRNRRTSGGHPRQLVVATIASALGHRLARQGAPKRRMATCRLELMGVYDYPRHAATVLRKVKGAGVVSGFNIPNKKPGEPLLEWAGTLLQEFPAVEVTVHYSLKHQRRENVVEAFRTWCHDAAAVGVSRVLLVTGPRGPRQDTVKVLKQFGRPVEGIRLGVAFNACLPTDAERELERQRLIQKLRTGLVNDVWLNTGVDEDLLRNGVAFVKSTCDKLNVKPEIFGSAMLPSEGQLQQMRERPWNGVQFSEEFLSSVEGMGTATSRALAVFREMGVEPILESKVKSDADISKLSALLKDDLEELRELLGAEGSAAKGPAVSQFGSTKAAKAFDTQRPGADEVFRPPRRRWGKDQRQNA
ncbi:RDH14 [Symbiodinium sp. CCMP2456]|nr:RDH14 [Symbiodinium sp. CCMP2456]